MNKIDCDIVNDLLPLYLENMVSDSAKNMIEAHVENCDECSNKLKFMKNEVNIPADNNTNVILKIKKQIDRKNLQTAIFSSLIVLVIAVLSVIHLNSPISLGYDQNIISVESNTDGNVSITLSKEVAGYSIESLNEGSSTYSMTCWNTLWNKYFFNNGKRTITIDTKEQNEKISKIYYYSTENQKPGDLLIYISGSKSEGQSARMVTLPRLVLNYYLIISCLLSVIGIIYCVVIKEKDNKKVSLRITLVPVSYFLSSVFVLMGRGDIYNSGYYFTRILILAIVLYFLIYFMLLKFYFTNK